jgi:subtilisin family serine protease
LETAIRAKGIGSDSILSLSFGSPVLDYPYLMAHVIAKIQSTGVVVVASAGNDAVSQPQFPAALPDVVGVGALGPQGVAPFSNYGPWVDACAPGVDIVSCFFTCKHRGCLGPCELHFEGWAVWCGTSFAGPIVAASLARLMMSSHLFGAGMSAKEARERLIDAPWLFRIPGLGTVVNPPMAGGVDA